MADDGSAFRRFPRILWKPKLRSLSVRNTLFGIFGAVAAVIGTAAALVQILDYVDLGRSEGFFEASGYETRVIRADPVHIGNTPRKFDYPYFRSPHSIIFDLPEIDRDQVAVLALEVADMRTTRHLELNGTLLLADPEVRNTGFDSWDSVFIVIDKRVLRPTGNELRITTLDGQGGTSGDVDDVLFRNIAILYRTQ
jgi:hypothetical protein